MSSIESAVRPTITSVIGTAAFNSSEPLDYNAYIGSGNWKLVNVAATRRTGVRVQNVDTSTDPQRLQVLVAPSGLYSTSNLPGVSSNLGDANGSCLIYNVPYGSTAQIPATEDWDIWLRSESTDPYVVVQDIAGAVDLYITPQPWELAAVPITITQSVADVATLIASTTLNAADYPSSTGYFAVDLSSCDAGVLSFGWTPSSALNSVLKVRAFRAAEATGATLLSDVPFTARDWVTLDTSAHKQEVTLPQGFWKVQMWAPFYALNTLSVTCSRINS